MNYKIEIEGGEAPIVIEAGTNDEGNGMVQSIKFKLNTIDNNTIDRDNGARAEFTIIGEANKDEDYEILTALAKWSITRNNVYRKFRITVYDPNSSENDGDKVVRTYYFDNIFCIDYEETFGGEESSNGTKFVLFAAQSKNYKRRDIDNK